MFAILLYTPVATMLSCYAVLYTVTCLVVTVSTGFAIPVLQKSETGLGTTRNLEQIFIGRCWEYQEVIRPDVFLDRLVVCRAQSVWGKVRLQGHCVRIQLLSCDILCA